MKTLLATAATASVLATSAFASGPVAPAPYVPPATVPVATSAYDWTGAYGGLTLGVPLGSNDWDGMTDNDWDGTVWGLTGGYDVQSGDWVYGAALDYSPSEFDATGTGSTTVENSAALRARIGRAFDRTLVYGTAGFATAEVTGAYAGATGNDRMNGYNVGLGVEQAITDNFSVNAEYLYTDLGTMSLATGDSDVNYGTFRIGGNFRF